MAACYFLHSFSGGAKSAEGPCEFDPPRQECTGKTSTGNTFACAAQRLGGGQNTVVFIIGTPQNGTHNFRKHPYSPMHPRGFPVLVMLWINNREMS